MTQNLAVKLEDIALEQTEEMQAQDIVAQAGKIAVIGTDDQLSKAGEIGKLLRDMKKTIVEHYSPIKKSMDAAKKVVLDKEKADLAPIEEAISRLSSMSTTYLTAKERARQEEERRLRAIEEEKARKEQERLLAQSAKAEEKGKTEKAEALLEKAEDVYVAPVHVAATGPIRSDSATTSGTKDLAVEVINLKAFVCELVAQDSNAFEALFSVSKSGLKAWAKSNGVKKFRGLHIEEIIRATVR